jgi:nucleotide-binding universal stress UspA family protein
LQCGSVVDPTLTPLVGYDGSESAKRALDRAASLTGYGSQLLVATASPDQAGLARSNELLDEAETSLISQRVFCRRRAVIGKPAQALMTLADENNVDLIVVGNGKTALQRLLLGSVSTEIVHHAPCNVMVVR